MALYRRLFPIWKYCVLPFTRKLTMFFFSSAYGMNVIITSSNILSRRSLKLPSSSTIPPANALSTSFSFCFIKSKACMALLGSTRSIMFARSLLEFAMLAIETPTAFRRATFTTRITMSIMLSVGATNSSVLPLKCLIVEFWFAYPLFAPPVSFSEERFKARLRGT